MNNSQHLRYALILLLFIITSQTGQLYVNAYTVTLFPLLGTAAIIYLLREEWLAYDFNTLKNKRLYVWVYIGLSFCIPIQAIGTLLLGQESTVAESNIANYAVLPLYILTGALLEEIVFRKILLGYFNKVAPFWLSALLSSSIYSLFHFNITRAIPYIAVGVVLCVIYKKSNTLSATILTHIALNIVGLIAITLRSG